MRDSRTSPEHIFLIFEAITENHRIRNTKHSKGFLFPLSMHLPLNFIPNTTLRASYHRGVLTVKPKRVYAAKRLNLPLYFLYGDTHPSSHIPCHCHVSVPTYGSSKVRGAPFGSHTAGMQAFSRNCTRCDVVQPLGISCAARLSTMSK